MGDGAPPTYEAKPRGVPTSRYVAQQEAERKAAEAKAAAANDDDLEADAAAKPRAEAPEPPKQLHAWVMIRGFKRDVQSTVYVEPTTGRAFSPEAAPYRGVEAVWNAKNYWVNMQRDVPVGSLNYDLSNANKWENLLYDQFAAFDEEAEEDDLEAEMRPQAEAPRAADPVVPAPASGPAQVLLDMPPTWVVRLGIERATFQARCPAGMKTTTYRKGRLDTFAEYSREDGMVDIRPQPRELDSDAELGLTVLAPGIALFALIAVVAQFAHPV